MKSDKPQREVRVAATPQRFEIRKNSDGTRTIAGTAVVFNAISEDLGGFQERIAAGAFTQSLISYPDVIIAYQHDLSQPLGRVSSGTAKVWQDERGLHYTCKLPDTSWARDLTALMARGDVSQNSFGFSVPPNGDAFSMQADGTVLRTVTQAVLWEISVVTTPAYSTVENVVSLRSCPVDLREKIAQRDEEEDDEDEDCGDPESPDYDEDACDEDEERSEESSNAGTLDLVAEHRRLLMLRLR